MNGPLSDSLWYRLDFSSYGSDGHVERMNPSSSNVTGSLLWRPGPRAELRFSFDLLERRRRLVLRHAAAADRRMSLEPLDVITTTTGEGIDARTRFLNYNVEDAINDSRQLLLRSDMELRLSDQVTLRNTLYGFGADRDWQNGDGFRLLPPPSSMCAGGVGEVQPGTGATSGSTTTSGSSATGCSSMSVRRPPTATTG